MPSMTIGTMLASVLQFIVIVGVLAPVLLLTTVGGGGVLTPGFAASFNGVVTNSSGFFVNPNGDLQSGLSSITAQNANGLAGGAGVLSSLGGLAFIPAAFGSFINLLFRSPGIMLAMFSTLLTPGAVGSGAYVNLSLIASMTIISGAFMAYCIAIFAMKLMTPITKVEIEDV